MAARTVLSRFASKQSQQVCCQVGHRLVLCFSCAKKIAVLGIRRIRGTHWDTYKDDNCIWGPSEGLDMGHIENCLQNPHGALILSYLVPYSSLHEPSFHFSIRFSMT